MEAITAHAVKNENGCLIWKGTMNAYGYGVITRQINPRIRIQAHRLLKELEIGRSLTDSEVAMHTCDTKACVNPEHIKLGSHKDNSADMVQKGRQQRWEHHGRAKLKREDIPIIRERYKAGKRQLELAEEFGVSRSQIGFIVSNKEWKDLPGDYAPDHPGGKRFGEANKMSKLTAEQVLNIRRLYKDGLTQYQLADQFSVSQGAISDIIIGKKWKHLHGNYSPDHVGRWLGEDHYASKLTENDVLNIRRFYSEGISQAKLAAQFGVCQPNISDIVRGKKWKHITMK